MGPPRFELGPHFSHVYEIPCLPAEIMTIMQAILLIIRVILCGCSGHYGQWQGNVGGRGMWGAEAPHYDLGGPRP